MAAALLYSSLKGKPSENLFYKRENESENVISKLKTPSSQPISPTGQAGYTNTAHVTSIFTCSRFPCLWGSIRSFYLKPWDTGPTVVWSKTLQGVTFGGGQFPLCWHPVRGLNANDQPVGFLWMHNPVSTSDLFNWKNHNPTYRKTAPPPCDWTFPFCLCHSPSLLGIYLHSWIRCFLGMRGGWMIIDTREEAHQHHLADSWM